MHQRTRVGLIRYAGKDSFLTHMCNTSRASHHASVITPQFPSKLPFGKILRVRFTLGLVQGPKNSYACGLSEFNGHFRYSYLHCHYTCLQKISRPSFVDLVYGPLLKETPSQEPPRDRFGGSFQARPSSAHPFSASVLLRTRSTMAASKPTFLLSSKGHYLCSTQGSL